VLIGDFHKADEFAVKCSRDTRLDHQWNAWLALKQAFGSAEPSGKPLT